MTWLGEVLVKDYLCSLGARSARVTVALLGILGFGLAAGSAQAGPADYCASNGSGAVFCEDFEAYTGFAQWDGLPSIQGLPLVGDTTDPPNANTWYGGRFEFPDNGNVEQDLALRQSTSFPSQHNYARFEDEAGILFNINTLGLTDVLLEFEWLTHNVSGTDRFIAGYYVGDIDFTTGTPDGSANDDLVRRFNLDGPAWDQPGGFVEIMRDINGAWEAESFVLPSNESSVWVAFWLDDGEGNKGKLDNVLVTATIPEPSTAILLALGLVTLAGRRSRASS